MFPDSFGVLRLRPARKRSGERGSEIACVVGCAFLSEGEPVPRATISSVRRWSTAEVTRPSRVDHYAAALSEAIMPFGIHRADPLTFHAEVSAAQLDEITVCKVDASRHGAFRGEEELARTRKQRLNLVLVLDCSWECDHRGHTELSPCDMLLHDSSRPLQLYLHDSSVSINVGFSEGWLRRWIPHPEELVGRCISKATVWGGALSAYVGALTPELVERSPISLSVIADQVGNFLALVADGLRRSAVLGLTPASQSLHQRISECISQRCTEPALTAVDVAASTGVSVRTLHRTFAAANESFAACLTQARVRVAVRMLTSRLFDRITTAEIGRRAGFTDPSHFTRVVRKVVGCTPRQLRHSSI